MRLKPIYVLSVITVIAILATWIALPAGFLNVAGAKDDVIIHQGLDLQGGLQVVLELP